ncbi:MAG TPA: hypothetical protein VEI94_16280 [Candidatus Bathyarchaeia archaeon]|nr:hypothetical protein [Candidatus Bathyarchaeia archaeon]
MKKPLIVAASALLLFLTSAAFVADASAAGYQTVDAFQESGAYSLIIIPDGWNGSLFLYAHGYSPDVSTLVPYPSDITPDNIGDKLQGGDALLQIALQFGYAVGTTTYRSIGWAVEDAIQDVENVRQRFLARYGQPKLTYMWGHSLGGLITKTIIEKEPNTFAGALPFCGPGAGARRNLNGAFDLRAVYEYACGGVAGTAFTCRVCSDGSSRCLEDADCPGGETCGAAENAPPPELGLTPQCTALVLRKPGTANEQPRYTDFVGQRLAACFGSDNPTPEQAARKDFVLRATQLPEDFLATDLFFATVALGEVTRNRTGGRPPWGNVGVDYASPLLSPAEQAQLNAGVVRTRNDPVATDYMRRFFEPQGRTSSKVLTLQALDDGLVIPENQEKYHEAFAAAGRTDQLVQLFTTVGGHCGFSVAEHVAAFLALTSWVEHGVKPTTSSAAATCSSFSSLGDCHLVDADPGEFGTRVVERFQTGVPIASYVCAGDAGDCPAGASCSLSTLHCASQSIMPPSPLRLRLRF